MLFLGVTYSQGTPCPKAQKYIDKRKNEEQNGKTIINAPLECYSDWAMYYALRCKCENEGVNTPEEAKQLAERVNRKRQYLIDWKKTECNLGEGLPGVVSTCKVKSNGDSQGGGAASRSEQQGPTYEERIQKAYEGAQVFQSKNQAAQERQDNLQDEFENPEGVEYVYIEDRSGEAAKKANYDASNDLDAMFEETETEEERLKREYLEEEEAREKALEIYYQDMDRLDEYQYYPTIDDLKDADPVEVEKLRKELKKQVDSPLTDTRDPEEIVGDDIFYEQGRLQYDNCDRGNSKQRLLSLPTHKPEAITLDDIENDPFLEKGIGDYWDEVKEMALEHFVGWGAAGAYGFYDQVDDQQEAMDKALEARDDIENVQEEWEDNLFSFNDEYVEDWMDDKKSITDGFMDRFKFWNKLRAIDITRIFEDEVEGLDHYEVMDEACDDVDYVYTGYQNDPGKELDKVIGKDGDGIFKTLFYGLGL